MEEIVSVRDEESSSDNRFNFPPGLNRKMVRPVVFIFFFLAGLCFASWASRIPDIKNMLHLSEAQLGSVLLALPAGSWTALPFSGRLVAHFGSKTMGRIA